MPIALRIACTLLSLGAVSGAVSQDGALDRLAFGAEYAAVGYTGTPTHNQIALLAARIERGEVRLEFDSQRRHLDSLLAALDIDPASQMLVYSRTSLQDNLISSATPRAIYFNDTTYVAWIPQSRVVEIVTVDAAVGPVFYVLGGERDSQPDLRRHTGTCLVCHDSFNGKVGGTPRLLAGSALTSLEGKLLGESIDVTDSTPLDKRWGGWYVSGYAGGTVHRGKALSDSSIAAPYVTGTSDVIALLVFEHQITVQNQITYVKYKAPAVLQRIGQADAPDSTAWAALPVRSQRALEPMLQRLVKTLLRVGAPPFEGRVIGTSGFERRFQARGPRDRAGRSLRELDLETRLFRYPLSYLIYSAEFDALPVYAKEYVYRAVADVLAGKGNEDYARLSADDRDAIRQILIDTRPEVLR